MASRVRVDLFCEDGGQESCGRALISRCAVAEGVAVDITARIARGGLPRVMTELRAFQLTVQRGTNTMPDLLVVMVYANDVGPAQRKRDVLSTLDSAIFATTVVGSPDPYVERWFLADPPSFFDSFGVQPDTSHRRDRAAWKQELVESLRRADQVVIQGGAEFAPDLFEHMDLYRAGRLVPSLGDFVSQLHAALRRLAARNAS